MKSETKKALNALIIASAVFGPACTTPAERAINERLVEEGPETRLDLNEEAREAIAKAPDLTERQRSDLTFLRQATAARLDGLRRESLKLRSLMVKDLVSPAYDASQMRVAERKLREVERERLEVMLDAMKKASRILGRQAAINEALMQEFVTDRPLPITE